MRFLLPITLVLFLVSCGAETNDLPQRDLFLYSKDNRDYFPDVIQARIDKSNFEYFASDYYTEILKRLGEPSLSDLYSGKDIIRLTVVKSFQNHFAIRIERNGDEIFVIEKETYRNSFPWVQTDSMKAAIGEHIEFDSLQSRYVKVKVKYFMGSDSIQELGRETIDPIVKNVMKKIKAEEWNRLVDQLTRNKFYDMKTQVGDIGFDGNHFLVETATRDGYFVVDRWSPKGGEFKEIVDHIIGLTDRAVEN